MTPSYHILGLQVENFMRVSAVSIHPNGDPVIQITGKNAEGKTSIINAIWAVLCWRAAAGSIPEPVRRGQESAQVRIDLGDLIVTRTWKGEKTSLTVTTREGAKYPSPQSVLDKLVSEIGFDPLEFVRMQPRDQRTTLMNLLKIDFSEFEKERSDLLQQKNQAQAQVSGLYQQIRETPAVPNDTPDEEISAGNLIQRLQESTRLSDRKKDIGIHLGKMSCEASEIHSKIQELQDRLQQLAKEQEGLFSELDQIDPEPLEPLQDQLRNIEEINRSVRLKQQKTKTLERLQQAEKQVNTITEAIGDIDQDKRDALAAAKFPVPGLSFDETGILLNGVPFAQASTAEQIRVSLAMGIALNPELRVLLIRDGNALDSDSLRMVEQMAKDADMQIWMERVDESGQVGVIIEDGTVKAVSGQQVIA
ncbi:MAG: AAA family ATPase [Methanospirillum sp.]|uniref:AAA family ATPase n=1 Tax=Methanospirillum sp. TaxID=45200 RepID=UPI00236B2231|nr:AAA family ATPase [Methanospirillum sp.]MDD1728767.1 AAA family ATPase [Methanospirillum sp.]